MLLSLLVCCYSFGFAQLLDVSSISEVNVPKGSDAGYFSLSPDGNFVLITDFSRNGLHKLDLTTNQITTISNAAGAGYNAKVLDDGVTVVFRETSFTKDNLRKNALMAKNLATGETKTLVKATRDLQGVTVKNGNVYAVEKGKLRAKQLNRNAKVAKQTPVVSISNRQLMITVNGKTSVLSPNGTGKSYLWPSVSADGSKVLYYVAGRGAYTCDINGNNVKFIGEFRAPKWYSNDIIIGMRDADDGYVTTSSAVIAKNINSDIEQALTDGSVIAMYPSSNLKGNRILFSTPEGKAYIININTK